MSAEKKTYVTTARAGFVVAGRRLPTVYGDDGAASPPVGYPLELFDGEAEYELAQGTIVLAPVKGGLKPAEGAGK